MVLTIQHTKEGLSRAYVSAVAYKAGVNLSLGDDGFDYGVDGTFKAISWVQNKRRNSGVNLEFQMKATQQWRLDGADIVYNLVVPAYRDLVLRMRDYRSERNCLPKILVLFCLPTTDAGWVECASEALTLRHCCYWSILEGDPRENLSAASKIQIRIPATQQLTPDAVRELLLRVKENRI